MLVRCLIFSLLLVTSCAVPRSHSEFSLSHSSDDGRVVEFASSKDLLVAGLVNEGLTFSKRGRLFDAEKHLRQALYLESNNDRIAFNLAVVLNQAGETEEALRTMKRLLAQEPHNPNYLQAAADIYVSQRDHETAREYLKRSFEIFKGAGNVARAALLARSISNLAFGIGEEQEALCYSFEALALSVTPAQVALHARLLVALNIFQQVEAFIKTSKGFSSEPLAYHALAMARYARGEYRAALDTEENALARTSQAPELSQEITAAWWVMKRKVPDAIDSDTAQERAGQMQDDVIRYAEKQAYETVMWPAALRRELVMVGAGTVK